MIGPVTSLRKMGLSSVTAVVMERESSHRFSDNNTTQLYIS